MAYSASQEARVVAAAPLNLEKAKVLADELGVTYRSVISKAKQLGVEYVKQVVVVSPTNKGPTKAALLQEIRSKLAMADREGDLTKAELEAILESLA